MSMPTMSEFSGPTKWDDYDAAFREWEASPEGVERKRQDEAKKVAAQRFYEEQIDKSILALIGKIGMPSRAREAVLGSLLETEAIKAATGAIDFLVLSGGPGCGKTVAAAAWMVAYVRDRSLWAPSDFSPRITGIEPVWITAAKLARWQRYDDEAMRKLLRTPRLVVDDLGGEYLDKAGFYASLLDEIVNERQAEAKPTIMTTNLNAEAFKERYGARIVDRIREGGRFFNCGDTSLRRRNP